VHVFPWLDVRDGYEALAAVLRQRLAGSTLGGQLPLVVLDGFAGVQWDRVIPALRAALEGQGVTADWLSTEGCFLSPERIAALLAPLLTEDPVLGRVYRGHLEELWDPGRAAALRSAVAARTAITIIYGPGASCVAQASIQVYLDMAKDKGFAIHRLEFDEGIEDDTCGKFVVLNLVEGERCEIATAGQAQCELRFAETVIIPASVGPYSLRNTGNTPCKAVKAFVKG
jgi:hypothetical protein